MRRRQTIQMTAAVAGMLAALLGVVGCTPGYDPPSLINKLRVVAVRAEPPVLSAVPTTLTPLVIGVAADTTLCHAWTLCLFAFGQDGNYACLDAELETTLGTAPTAQVSLAQAAPLASKLSAVFEKRQITIPKQFRGSGGATPGLGDAGGFEVFVRFKVAEVGSADVATSGVCPSDAVAWLAEPCADRDRCIAGYKRLALALNAKDMHKNPVITKIQLDGVDWPDDVTPTVPCYLGNDFYGQVGNGAVAMRPVWSPSSLEVIGPDPDPTVAEPVREGLLFSWLSTAGGFDKQRTFDKVPENSFFPPDYAGIVSRMVRIWVVARDGRNGTTWTSRQIEVKSVPDSAGNPLCRARPTLAGCD